MGRVIEGRRRSRKAFARTLETAAGAARVDGGLQQCALLGSSVAGPGPRRPAAHDDMQNERYPLPWPIAANK